MELEEVLIDQLKPHKRNYRSHPDDEIAHLMESISSNGIYRNIVVAQDGTILAGHGVFLAACQLGMTSIPVYRMLYGPNDARALKLLVSDNMISHLAADDDRSLTELLKELKDADIDLFGTGYDDMMLANLLMVTRTASEIEDFDAAAAWVGMPEHDQEGEKRLTIIVNFTNESNRQAFCQLLGLDADKIPTEGSGKSVWWPKQAKNDVSALRWKSEGKNE